MQNTSYVLVPYEEYQQLLSLKKDKEKSDQESIFFRNVLSYELFDWSVRTYNCLQLNFLHDSSDFTKKLNRSSIVRVGELVTLREWEVLKIYQLGRKSLNEIKSELKKHNLTLGMQLSQEVLNKLKSLQNILDS